MASLGISDVGVKANKKVKNASNIDTLIFTAVAVAVGFMTGFIEFKIAGYSILGGTATISGITMSIGFVALAVLTGYAWVKYRPNVKAMYDQKIPIVYVGTMALATILYVLNGDFSNIVTQTYYHSFIFTVLTVGAFMQLYRYQDITVSASTLSALNPMS